MKALFLVFFGCFFGCFAWADSAPLFYQVGDQFIQFDAIEFKDRSIVVSTPCAETKRCEALRVFRKSQQLNHLEFAKKLHSSGGESPAVAVCEKGSGEIEMAIDLQRNQQAFCRFKDRSRIALEALW